MTKSWSLPKCILIVFSTVILTGWPAAAQEKQNSPPLLTGRWIEEADQEIKLVLSDGREATFQAQTQQTTELGLDHKLIETDCGANQIDVQCKLKMSVRPYSIQIVWSKHPDSLKLGQQVRVRFQNQGMTEIIPLVLTFESDISGQASNLDLPPVPGYSFECNTFKWIDPLQSEAPDKLNIVSWSTEAMFLNIETDQCENMTIGGGQELKCEKNAPQSVAIVSGLMIDMGFNSGLISSGNTSVVLENSSRLCANGFGVENFGRFQNEFRNVFDKAPVDKSWWNLKYDGRRVHRKLLSDNLIDSSRFNVYPGFWGMLE